MAEEGKMEDDRKCVGAECVRLNYRSDPKWRNHVNAQAPSWIGSMSRERAFH